MRAARLLRRPRAAALPLIVVLGFAGLAVSPFFSDPLVPLAVIMGISAVLVLSAIYLSRRDAVALLTTVLVLMFLVPQVYVLAGPLKSVGNPAQLIGMLALALWGAGRVLGLISARRGNPVRWLAFGWVLAALVAFTSGMLRVLTPDESAGAIRVLFPMAAMIGILLLALDGLPSRDLVEVVLYRLVLLAGVSALIGVVEFSTGFSYRSALRLPGLVSNTEDFIDTRSGFVRVVAGASHPIEYAVVLTVVAPLALHFALHGAPWRRRGAWVAFLAILVVNPMTVSRSGLLGLAIGMIVYGVALNARARLNALVLGLIGLALFRAAVPGLLGTLRYFVFAGSQDNSITGRTEDYAHIPGLIHGHLMFGRGLGTFQPSQYFFVDNQYILTYLEEGLVGVSVLVAIFVVGMSTARGYRKRSVILAERSLGQALAASIAATAASAAAFDEFSFRQILFAFALILGCAGALWNIAKARQESSVELASDAPLSPVGASVRAGHA